MAGRPRKFASEGMESHRPRMQVMFSSEADRARELMSLAKDLTCTFERMRGGTRAAFCGCMLIGGFVGE